jgi:tetratricopeptide (TPR) repeat protein
MDHRTQRLAKALELNSYLNDPLPVGFDLRDEAIRLLKEEMDPAALRTCRELYQVGLNASSALVQAVACFLLGMVYYVSGKRPSDLHRGIEQLDRSVQLFHSAMNSRHEHNEGVVWLALGVAYETLAKQSQGDRWKEAIKAYQEAGRLFRMHNDPLVGWAEDAERYATHQFAEWLKIKSHTDMISRMPRPEKPSPLTVLSHNSCENSSHNFCENHHR